MFPAHSASCLALSAPGSADSASQDRILPARQQDHADMAAEPRGVFDGQNCATDFTLQHDLQIFLDSHLKTNMGPKYLCTVSLQHENIINYNENMLLKVVI